MRKLFQGKGQKTNWFLRMKLWQRIALCTGGVVLCLAAGIVLFVMSKWEKVETEKIDVKDIVINQEVREGQGLDLGEGYTNVALFGVDSRDGNLGKGNRTDCIIVASLNNETKEVKMVSVYRDTLLNLSEGTYKKCNAAYSFGGPVMAINMLNMNLDLDIQEYVTVDFGAIADAIDLLGGVEIEVTDVELPYINKYIPETARSAGKKSALLKHAGKQLLNGTQATTYARIRSTAGGDFTRTERQRLVIEKMVEKGKGASLATINSIIDKVFPQISTSFTLPEILKYATAYKEYRLTDNIGFPIDKTTATLSGYGSIVIPQSLSSNVTQLHEFLFGRTEYSPSSAVNTISSAIQSRTGSAPSYHSGQSGQYNRNSGTSSNGNGGSGWSGGSSGNGGSGWSGGTSGNSGTSGNGTGQGNGSGTASGGDSENPPAVVPPSEGDGSGSGDGSSTNNNTGSDSENSGGENGTDSSGGTTSPEPVQPDGNQPEGGQGSGTTAPEPAPEQPDSGEGGAAQ